MNLKSIGALIRGESSRRGKGRRGGLRRLGSRWKAAWIQTSGGVASTWSPRRAPYAASFALASFALALGCSADSEESSGLTQRIRQPSGFCQEWAELVCTERVVERCAAASVESCAAAQEAHCQELVSDVEYNPEFAELCLAAARGAIVTGELNQEGYATLTALGGDCGYLGSAGIAIGGSCQRDFDCDPTRGLVCAKAGDDGLGVCASVQIVEGGFECSGVAQRCEAGFYCDAENCLALRAEGQSCGDAEPCAAGLKCRQGQCDPQWESGSTCDVANDCLSGLCAETGNDVERLCVDRVVLSVSEPVCRKLR